MDYTMETNDKVINSKGNENNRVLENKILEKKLWYLRILSYMILPTYLLLDLTFDISSENIDDQSLDDE